MNGTLVILLGIAVLVIAYLIYINDKKNQRLDHLEYRWNTLILESMKTSAKEVKSITGAVLLAKRYSEDVPESFRLRNPISADLYEGSMNAVLKAKTFSELLLSLGDLEEITKKDSQAFIIWKHIHQEVRSSVEAVVLETLTGETSKSETVAQITRLYDEKIVRSESIRQALGKNEPL